MKVSELAKELDVPSSAVLDQCQRFGIDATWAGADLRRSDVVVLRAELAIDEGAPVVDAGPSGEASAAEEVSSATPEMKDGHASSPDAESVDEPEVGATARDGAASLPPTAVGSMLELFEGDEQPAIDPSVAEPAAVEAGGFSFAGADAGGPSLNVGEAAPRTPAARNRHFDHGLRSSAAAFGVAAALMVASNLLFGNPWPLGLAWVLAGITIVFGTVRAAQARYRASTHPERIRGLAFATVLTGVGLVALVIFGLAVWTVARDAPPEDAALGLGRPAAVKHLRWGFARLLISADHGMDPIAKDPGSCWRDANAEKAKKDGPRRKDRIEVGSVGATCARPHTYEVIDRWSVDHVRDTPYPDVPAFQAMVVDRCTGQIDRLNRGSADGPPAGATLGFEYPTATGWAAGDHDVTCVAQTADRRGRLAD